MSIIGCLIVGLSVIVAFFIGRSSVKTQHKLNEEYKNAYEQQVKIYEEQKKIIILQSETNKHLLEKLNAIDMVFRGEAIGSQEIIDEWFDKYFKLANAGKFKN